MNGGMDGWMVGWLGHLERRTMNDACLPSFWRELKTENWELRTLKLTKHEHNPFFHTPGAKNRGSGYVDPDLEHADSG